MVTYFCKVCLETEECLMEPPEGSTLFQRKLGTANII